MPGPASVFVHLLPSLMAPGALRGGVAVVIDVLRATTVMVHALASGCEAIVPCLEIDEARRVAASYPPGGSILGGERRGLPIEGFDLGNSPASYTEEVCRGRTLVMTTTNGTRAILACQEADRVMIASFPNLGATAGVLAADLRPIHLVCAGTDGLISLEDALLAGALADSLRSAKNLGNDEAQIALALWSEARRRGEATAGLVADRIGEGRGGRRVREIGLGADVADAARIDRFPLVAELLRDPLRIVATGP